MLEQQLLAAERERAVARRIVAGMADHRDHRSFVGQRRRRASSRRGPRHGRAGGGSATSRQPARSPRQARSPCVRNGRGSRARGARRPGSIRFRPRPACSAADRRPKLAAQDRAARARTLRTRGSANLRRVPPGTAEGELDQAGIAAVQAAQEMDGVGEVAAGVRAGSLEQALRCGWRAQPSPATRASWVSATLTELRSTDRLIAIPFPSSESLQAKPIGIVLTQGRKDEV